MRLAASQETLSLCFFPPLNVQWLEWFSKPCLSFIRYHSPPPSASSFSQPMHVKMKPLVYFLSLSFVLISVTRVQSYKHFTSVNYDQEPRTFNVSLLSNIFSGELVHFSESTSFKENFLLGRLRITLLASF